MYHTILLYKYIYERKREREREREREYIPGLKVLSQHNNYSIITPQNHWYVIEADDINRFKLHGAVTDSTDCYICTRSPLTGFTNFLR